MKYLLLLLFCIDAATSIAQLLPAHITNNAAQTDNNITVTDSTYIIDTSLLTAEQMPEFPGGQRELMKFISKQIIYPVDAVENGIQGKVIVQFVIEKDGSVSNVKVLQSVYRSLDAEAIRVVQILPNWSPGIMDGKPVRIKYVLPINFTLR